MSYNKDTADANSLPRLVDLRYILPSSTNASISSFSSSHSRCLASLLYCIFVSSDRVVLRIEFLSSKTFIIRDKIFMLGLNLLSDFDFLDSCVTRWFNSNLLDLSFVFPFSICSIYHLITSEPLYSYWGPHPYTQVQITLCTSHRSHVYETMRIFSQLTYSKRSIDILLG